jgi:ABC-type transport system involved in cytochrome c biogenesis ATPase subunit
METLAFEHVSVSGFRGIGDAVELDLASVNLVVGPNNTGKTALLEALQLLCDPLSEATFVEVATSRTEYGLGEGRLESVRWLFHRAGDEPDAIQLTARGRERRSVTWMMQEAQRLEPSRAGGRARVPVIHATAEATLGGRKRPRHTDFTVAESETIESRLALPGRVPCTFVSVVSHRTAGFGQGFGEVWLEGRFPSLISLIRTFDPAIRDVRLIEVDGTTSYYVEREGHPPAPVNSFGDGLRRAIVYAAALAESEGGLLLIDELESALHRDVIVPVFRWLVEQSRRLGVQIVATTHSLEACDAVLEAVAGTSNAIDDKVPPRLSRELAVVRLRRTPSGVDARLLAGDTAWLMRYGRGLELR